MSTNHSAPRPIADLWEWQYEGLCRTMSPEAFFHPEGERGAARRRRAEAVKAICAQCPVLESCRDHALAVREPYGVWGGLTEEERESYHQAMKAGATADEALALVTA